MLRREHLIGAGFFILPFLFFSGIAGEPIRAAKEIGLVTIATLGLAWMVRQKIHWACGVVVLYLGFNLCTTGFGPAQKDAVVQVLAALMCAYMVLSLSESGRVWVLHALAYAGLLQSVYGFFQVAGIDPFFRRISDNEFLYPVGTLGQPTIYGVFVACALVSALFLRHWIIALTCFVAVALTMSSFSIASMLAGVLTYLFLSKYKQEFAILLTACVLAVATLVALSDKFAFAERALYSHNRLAIWAQSIQAVTSGCITISDKGLEATGPYKVSCNGSRTIHPWEVLVAKMERRPLNGFGIGSFKALYNTIQPDIFRLQSGRFIQAHNDYVQIFFEGGVVGLLVTFLLLGLFAYRLLFDYLTFTQRAFAAIGVCLFVDSFGSFPLYLSPHGLLIAVSMMVVIAKDKVRLLD